MNTRFIIHDFIASMKQWTRSKGTVFWTVLFPVLLILIFGSIFSGSDEVSYEFGIQDLDESTYSTQFIGILENISMLDIKTINKDKNITSYMEKEGIVNVLQIPSNFGSIIERSFVDQNATVDVKFYFDPSEQTTTSIVRTIVTNTLQQYNMGITGGRQVIDVSNETIIQEEFDFIDYFIPGMIGFTIMTSCIYGSIERNTKYRKDGILRKMLTMPVSRTEWILSKMLFMLFLSFLSTTVILLVGVLIWGIKIHITVFAFIDIIATSFLFSGMGMLISRFVKEEETADMAGGAITFPMMFLSGTFFSLDMMPWYLQTVAQALPLYYVSEALRNTMIYENMDKTIYFTGFVLLFAFAFFLIGAIVTKWEDE